MSLYLLSFYASICFTVVGAILGLIGIWNNDFWKSETGWKLIATNFVLATASIIVAVVTKFLGS
jgi:uncharacterized membrane protein YiaA